jgi:hypothetical protein
MNLSIIFRPALCRALRIPLRASGGVASQSAGSTPSGSRTANALK